MDKAYDSRVDAVRYIILRKLAAGMRHALMGELQAIQFASDLAAQMVKRGVTGSQLSDAVSQISDQTRAAAAASRSIMEWVRPESGSSTAVAPALQECVKLAGEVWILRGIKTTASCETGHVKVAKPVFFELVVASLLALTDVYPGSLDINLTAEQVGGRVVVKLCAQAADRRSATPSMLDRALTLDDVTMLAATHGISCACNDATITLEFQPILA
jgi:hypothetical protein